MQPRLGAHCGASVKSVKSRLSYDVPDVRLASMTQIRHSISNTGRSAPNYELSLNPHTLPESTKEEHYTATQTNFCTVGETKTNLMF